MSSGGAGKWVKVCTHRDLNSAISELRGRGMQIAAAHLDDEAVDYREVDFTRPTAVMLGAELEGISPAGLDQTDVNLLVPMAGMVQSLNVSVAAAVILFEARRQRQAAGLYDRRRIDEAVYARTLFEWCHPQVADYCRRKNHPYPALDDNGDIAGPIP
jgi:tRNA (guanosine-2'-O-)-methyltransferase